MWHNLKKDPPKKAGQYLVFIDVIGCNDLFVSVEHYFMKGDFICTIDSDKETPEERLKDFIFNEDLELHAWQDGFYKLSNTSFNAEWDKTLNFNRAYDVYWSELPDPPKGKIWGCLGKKE